MRKAEGVADRDHRLADHEVGRAAERDHGQPLARLHAEDGDVRVGVGADELRVELPAVGERHVDAAGAEDHVLVGEDGAVRGDDDAGAEAGAGEAAGAGIEEVAEELLEERVLGEGEGRAPALDHLLGGDVHHRGARPLDRLDHGAPPQGVGLKRAHRGEQREEGQDLGRAHSPHKGPS